MIRRYRRLMLKITLEMFLTPTAHSETKPSSMCRPPHDVPAGGGGGDAGFGVTV